PEQRARSVARQRPVGDRLLGAPPVRSRGGQRPRRIVGPGHASSSRASRRPPSWPGPPAQPPSLPGLTGPAQGPSMRTGYANSDPGAAMTATAALAPTGHELEALLAPLGDRHYGPERCAALADVIAEIGALKRARNAVVLAHNYQRPEIFAVADFVGDSLELARQATRVEADTTVFF